ncbi:hypothetical protein N0M98_09665 [Paenibacillus doosanensis]|nr:hypothetical protein [Paenibacillus doosanensis]
MFEYDYLKADYIQYSQLVKASDSTASLSGATEGRMTSSGRYRNVLSPAGFCDELRAALIEWEDIGSAVLPRPVRTAYFRALSTAPDAPSPAKTCVRLSGYPYLMIRASRLEGTEDAPRLAVSFIQICRNVYVAC